LVAAIVISYCTESLDWVADAVGRLSSCLVDVQKIYVYSKCDHSRVPKALEGFPKVIFQKLLNVGRWHHTYAYHLNRDVAQKTNLTLFLRSPLEALAQPKKNGVLDVCHLAANAAKSGFSCGITCPRSIEPACTVWHETSELMRFSTLPARNKTTGYTAPSTPSLGAFWQAWFSKLEKKFVVAPGRHDRLPYTGLPSSTVVPVCYGGTFAASSSNIGAVHKEFWPVLEESLRRGDNIEEGEFVERLWAALLAPLNRTPAGRTYAIQLLNANGGELSRSSPEVKGMLVCRNIVEGTPRA